MPLRPLTSLALLSATVALPAQAPREDWFRYEVVAPDYVFHFKPRVNIPDRPKVALALSGGGARGVAHIGVLQRMDELDLPVDCITGTSAGALMGTLYACGFDGAQIEHLFRHVDFGRAFLDPLSRTSGQTLDEQEAENGSVFSLQMERGLPIFALALRTGVSVQKSLEGFLARGAYFSGGDFDKLRVPLRTLATNLERGEGKAFAKGDLVEAVRASMAVPGAFRPVVIDGQQYIDGALEENIPVLTARRAFKPDLVLAVDVSTPMERGWTSNLLSLTARSLDLVIERRQLESRASADCVVRPSMQDIPFMDYARQLPVLIKAGRDAFDQQLPTWREILLGSQRIELDPEFSRVEFEGYTPAPAEAMAFLQRLAPPGKPVPRHAILALIQQSIAHDWARRVHARLDENGVVKISFELHETVRHLEVEAPLPWRLEIQKAFQQAFPPGTPYRPSRFGSLLNSWVQSMVVGGAPLVDARGSGFDPTTGTLRAIFREPRIRRVEVRGGSPIEADYIQSILAPLSGSPLRTQQLRNAIDLLEQRLHLSELRYQLRPLRGAGIDGAELILSPIPHQSRAYDLALGYENTLGSVLALRYQALNIKGRGAEFYMEASRHRLEHGGAMRFLGPLKGFPGAGLEVGTAVYVQRLGTLAGLKAEEIAYLPHTEMGTTDVSMGSYLRVGSQGKGKVSLSMIHRSAYFQQIPGRSARQSRLVQASYEWDSFDRHTLPRQGSLVRVRYGEGRAFPGLEPWGHFRVAYLRARTVRSLATQDQDRALGIDFDLEYGYGKDAPLDRWWILGGPHSIIGTPSMEYRAPNFLIARLALPMQTSGPLGLPIHLQPRLDVGVLSKQPRDLFTTLEKGWSSATPSPANPYGPGSRGVRVLATGVQVRTMLSRFFVEASYGVYRFKSDDQPWTRSTSSLNVVIGTHPFDLWRHR